MTKKGPFFGPQNVRKSRRAKMGLPSMQFRVPISLALSLCQYILRPKRGLAQASPGLAWPLAWPRPREPRSASIAGLHQHTVIERERLS